jgi:hypothetical protein
MSYKRLFPVWCVFVWFCLLFYLRYAEQKCVRSSCPKGYLATHELDREPSCMCEPGALP